MQGVDAPDQAGLAVGRLVLVDDAPGAPPCPGASPPCADPRPRSRRRVGADDGLLDPGLDLGPGRLVAQAGHLVGPVALDLALDVGHCVLLHSARELGRASSSVGSGTRDASRRTPAAVIEAGRCGPGRRPRWPRPARRTPRPALAPMRAPSPTVTAPRTLAPAPMNTSSPMIGTAVAPVVPADGHPLMDPQVGPDPLGRQDGALPVGDEQARADHRPAHVQAGNALPHRPGQAGQEGAGRVARQQAVVVHAAELREGVQEPAQHPGPVGDPEHARPTARRRRR